MRFPAVADLGRKAGPEVSASRLKSSMLWPLKLKPQHSRRTLDMLQIKNLLSRDMRKGFRFNFRRKAKARASEMATGEALFIENSRGSSEESPPPQLDERQLFPMKSMDSPPPMAQRLRLTASQHFSRPRDSSRNKRIFRQTSIFELPAEKDPLNLSKKRTRSLQRGSSPEGGGIFEFSDSVQIFRLQGVAAHQRPSRFQTCVLNPQTRSMAFHPTTTTTTTRQKSPLKPLSEQPSKRLLRKPEPLPLPLSSMKVEPSGVELYRYYDSQIQ